MSKSTTASGRPAWLLPVIIVGALAALAALVAVISGAFRPAYVPEVTGEPRAVLDRTTIDHGPQRFNEQVESVFQVRNVGDEPLVILGEPRVELVEGC